VKCTIKFIPDKEEASQVKVICSYKAQSPDRTNIDTGIIVDGELHTQTPVSAERAVQVLNFTGEETPKLKLTK
jgi:hypothetical protein